MIRRRKGEKDDIEREREGELKVKDRKEGERVLYVK